MKGIKETHVRVREDSVTKELKPKLLNVPDAVVVVATFNIPIQTYGFTDPADAYNSFVDKYKTDTTGSFLGLLGGVATQNLNCFGQATVRFTLNPKFYTLI